jgi:hypothetical protein
LAGGFGVGAGAATNPGGNFGGFGPSGFGPYGGSSYSGQPGYGLDIGTIGTPGSGLSGGWGYGAGDVAGLNAAGTGTSEGWGGLGGEY